MVEPKIVWLKKVILLLKIKIWQSHGDKPIQVRVVKSLTRRKAHIFERTDWNGIMKWLRNSISDGVASERLAHYLGSI
jgi:hypothetical protein